MLIAFIRRAAFIAALAALCAAYTCDEAHGQFSAPAANSAFSIPQTQLLQPVDLSRMLLSGSPERPLILQVGSRMLFEQAHIKGAEFTGAGSQDDGLKQLQSRVAALPHNTSIVIYCGCCPWNRCPNIAPAFKLLRSLGFTRVKALYLANNFGTDWADKGYPVERGH